MNTDHSNRQYCWSLGGRDFRLLLVASIQYVVARPTAEQEMEQHSDLLLVTLSTDMIKNNLSTKRFNGDAVLLEGNRTLNPSMSVLAGNRNNKV